MLPWSVCLCRAVLVVACVSFSTPLSAQTQIEAPPAAELAAPPAAVPDATQRAAALRLATSDDYNAVIREAILEFKDGLFAESHALFARAHELQPSARTWRGLGMSAFGLRTYEDAVISLETALASTVRPLDPALRSETEELLARAYGFVGRYTLGVDPDSAQLLVDDVETVLRTGDRLLLAIGRHRLEARAPAYVSDLRSLDVVGGENTGLSFTLARQPEPVVVATPTEAAQTAMPVVTQTSSAELAASERPDKAPLYKNPYLWAGVGAAVVIIVVAASVVAASGDELRGVSRTANTPDAPMRGILTVP